MDKQKKIIEALRKLHAKSHYDASSIIVGKVIKVDGINLIDVDVEGIVYHDVQLQAIEDGSGTSLIVVPANGSQVLIGNIEQCTGYVLLKADKADRILLKQSDGMYIDIVKGVVKLNGDSKGGLVQIQELKDNIDALKTYIEAMHAALPAAFSAILASTSANGALGAQAYQLSMAGQVIIIKDMENKNVKHA